MFPGVPVLRTGSLIHHRSKHCMDERPRCPSILCTLFFVSLPIFPSCRYPGRQIRPFYSPRDSSSRSEQGDSRQRCIYHRMRISESSHINRRSTVLASRPQVRYYLITRLLSSMVEYWFCKPNVIGSSPIVGYLFSADRHKHLFLFFCGELWYKYPKLVCMSSYNQTSRVPSVYIEKISLPSTLCPVIVVHDYVLFVV